MLMPGSGKVSVKLVCGWLVWGAVSCAGDPLPSTDGPDGGGCSFDEDSRLTFTEVVRADDLSNAACPMLKPADLNGQFDAGADACEVTANADCSAGVKCLFLGTIEVSGTVRETDKGLEGRFEVTTPIPCVYFVTARADN